MRARTVEPARGLGNGSRLRRRWFGRKEWNVILSDSELQSQAIFRRTLQKYIVMQIPGATMVAVLLVVFYYAGYISMGMAALLFTGWCVKDAVMFRFLRSAYEPGPPHGTDALIGLRGVVVDELAPTGSVRVGAEQWSARAADANHTLEAGARVRVVAVDGYTLTVARDERD